MRLVRFEDLIAVVGPVRYELACVWAKLTATDRADELRPWPNGLDQIPHDLSDPLWYEGDISAGQRLALGIRLLWEMPCYANTMYLQGFYADWSDEERAFFWDAYTAMLDSESQANPVGYSLWADIFGPDQRGEDAWDAVFGAGRETPPRRLDRVLPLTGPVRWRTKSPLLIDLLQDEARHPAIYRALLGAEFDYFGAIDRSQAGEILDQLMLPRTAEHLSSLRERLAHRG